MQCNADGQYEQHKHVFQNVPLFTWKIQDIHKTLVAQRSNKGNRAIADLRYAKDDGISPSILIYAATKAKLGIYILHIPPEVL